ncbi:MAG: hypothetical protein M0Z94_20905, partial [Dehalococcoidales bacterium]|nr:hypothetical protein [Dehalococcoidales bacterium]
MLRYTGHPLVDVGAATIVAYVGKTNVEAVTEADLEEIVKLISREYVRDPLKSFLNVAFPNSGFTQPAFEKKPERRREYANRVLRESRMGQSSELETCPFTGKPATAISFSDSLPPGRAFRQHVPLLTGEGVINFHPWGDVGLPISGEAMLCIQAFPLGCAKIGGRLLAVHSDNPDLICEFASRFVKANLSALMLAQQEGSKKMPEAPASARTLLIRTLLEVEAERRNESADRRPSSVSAYHLTNSGQSNALDPRNPPLAIYHLPLELTDFLASMVSPEYSLAWHVIEERGWQLATPKGKVAAAEDQGKTPRRTNVLYEDLFGLPENAPFFVRRYFLRFPLRTHSDADPRHSYSLRKEADLVSWKLTELFVRKVMGMNKDRADLIRKLGDQLAEYVSSENDKRFFASFFEHRY